MKILTSRGFDTYALALQTLLWWVNTQDRMSWAVYFHWCQFHMYPVFVH